MCDGPRQLTLPSMAQHAIYSAYIHTVRSPPPHCAAYSTTYVVLSALHLFRLSISDHPGPHSHSIYGLGLGKGKKSKSKSNKLSGKLSLSLLSLSAPKLLLAGEDPAP